MRTTNGKRQHKEVATMLPPQQGVSLSHKCHVCVLEAHGFCDRLLWPTTSVTVTSNANKSPERARYGTHCAGKKTVCDCVRVTSSPRDLCLSSDKRASTCAKCQLRWIYQQDKGPTEGTQQKVLIKAAFTLHISGSLPSLSATTTREWKSRLHKEQNGCVVVWLGNSTKKHRKNVTFISLQTRFFYGTISSSHLNIQAAFHRGDDTLSHT